MEQFISVPHLNKLPSFSLQKQLLMSEKLANLTAKANISSFIFIHINSHSHSPPHLDLQVPEMNLNGVQVGVCLIRFPNTFFWKWLSRKAGNPSMCIVAVFKRFWRNFKNVYCALFVLSLGLKFWFFIPFPCLLGSSQSSLAVTFTISEVRIQLGLRAAYWGPTI